MKQSVVSFAYEIIEMDREIHSLRAENARLREVEKRYHAFVNSSVKAGEASSRNMLAMALSLGDDGVGRLKQNLSVMGMGDVADADSSDCPAELAT